MYQKKSLTCARSHFSPLLDIHNSRLTVYVYTFVKVKWSEVPFSSLSDIMGARVILK